MGPLHQIRHTSQVSVSAHVSSNAQKVHWHEDAINTSKSEPKMDFADGFVHKLAATPMIRWKCATTKYVSCSGRSTEGCARNNPESPPVTKSDTKPSANIIAVVK